MRSLIGIILALLVTAIAAPAAADCEVETPSTLSYSQKMIEARVQIENEVTSNNWTLNDIKTVMLSGSAAMELISAAYSARPALFNETELMCYVRSVLSHENSQAILVYHQGKPSFLYVPHNSSDKPSWHTPPEGLIDDLGEIVPLNEATIDNTDDPEPAPEPKPWPKYGKTGEYSLAGTTCTCADTPFQENNNCSACTQEPVSGATLADFETYLLDLDIITTVQPGSPFKLWQPVN